MTSWFTIMHLTKQDELTVAKANKSPMLPLTDPRDAVPRAHRAVHSTVVDG